MLKKILTLILFISSLSAGSRFMASTSLVDGDVAFDLDVASVLPAFGENSYFLGIGTMSIGKIQGTNEPLYRLYALKMFMETDMNPFEGVRLEMGLKGVYAQINGRDYWAAPIGTSLFYLLPDNPYHLLVRGSFFYGPAHLAFNTAKDYLEYRIGVGISIDQLRQFIESGLGGKSVSYVHFFFEYCSINTNYNDVDVVLNQAFYGGMKIAF